MERHANKNNLLETIKVPLQGTTKTGKTIFAYLRRSTTNKQELSIQKQEDYIWITIKNNGINEKDVEYFIESKSAYGGVTKNNWKTERKRTEFTRMLKAIDESKKPCTILTYEPSRLSRNDPDTDEILSRLFWEYEKKKRNIEKIMFNNGDTWDEKSNKGSVKQILLDAYKESERTWKRSKDSTINQLRERHRYLYATPIGIDRLKKWEAGLKTNEKMSFIYKAFEMKAWWITNKEIAKYLSKNGIKIPSRKLTERYFKNTLYIGYYSDQTTWEIYDVAFDNWKFPLPKTLWDAVNSSLWKKKSTYWEKQIGDPLRNILKTDTGKAMNRSVKKGKYVHYENRRLGIGISQYEILKGFIVEITGFLISLLAEKYRNKNEIQDDVLNIVSYKWWEDMVEESWKNMEEIFERFPQVPLQELHKHWFKTNEDAVKAFIIATVRSDLENQIHKNKDCYNDIIKVFKNHWVELSEESWITEQKLLSEISDKLKQKDKQDNGETYNQRELMITNLKDKIKDLEEKKKIYRRDAVIAWYDKEEIFETSRDMEIEIKQIESEIDELVDDTDLEKYLDRMPEILTKIHELASKSLTDEDMEEISEDLFLLIQITTHELNVNNKKKLKVELNPVLSSMISKGNTPMEHLRGCNVRTFVEGYDRAMLEFYNRKNNIIIK